MKPDGEGQQIAADSREIAQCEWLPLGKYVQSTIDTADGRGVPDTMNSFFMRSVGAMLDAGVGPAEWGWAETELPSVGGGSVGQITGLTKKKAYKLYHPPAFLPPRPQ